MRNSIYGRTQLFFKNSSESWVFFKYAFIIFSIRYWAYNINFCRKNCNNVIILSLNNAQATNENNSIGFFRPNHYYKKSSKLLLIASNMMAIGLMELRAIYLIVVGWQCTLQSEQKRYHTPALKIHLYNVLMN